MTRFKLQLGDITTMHVDAIVNSTDSSLLDGGPVHSAVHRVAGPALLDECEQLKGCPVGEARITSGYQLPASFVIHTVAPTWVGGHRSEKELLANCYRNCLRLAEARGLKTIAFPSLGSGLQPQIPLDVAAPVVVRTMLDWTQSHALPEQVLFVCIEPTTFQIHQRVLREMLP